MRPILGIAAALLLAISSNAHGMWHLWKMNELYSNADGTVQFLELTALAGQQQFLQGHSLVSRSGSTARTFSFPTDLPGETTGVRMLVATEGFRALGIVTPDYVVPDGFFFHGGGSVDFAGVDLWSFGTLPVDGRSLDRDGTATPNSPQNFAGKTGNVTASPSLSFQGLWWRSPPGSESGWGLGVAHQGDVVFATWFTYDLAGRQMWLVAPEARRVAGNTFAGRLYRTSGPAFSANPWNPGAVNVTDVGAATLTFADADNGRFTYTVDGVTQEKAIARQVLGR